jgi:hypothetical protein
VRATFDDSKIVRITGIVIRIDWTNPHVLIFVQAKDEISVYPCPVEVRDLTLINETNCRVSVLTASFS